ncbi:uncharacterized protein LOC117341154 [Pecten maximus]|uniref:uncharacterized protein LOC117341154 n=1 Tax=Pecten maximus TaxID=6579 RepID=UPI0014588503|nr:uncharacterized protein LOC117341154 [Pecten maximus]
MPNADIIDNLYTGSRYAVHTKCTSYANSKSTCQSVENTHLVHLETEAEQQWLYQELTSRSLPTRFWIGLEKVSGEWSWVDTHGSTPITNIQRLSSYNPYGPNNCLTYGDTNWQQMNPSNCFCYICEYVVPVVETTTEATTAQPTAEMTTLQVSTGQSSCSVMDRYSGVIPNAAVYIVVQRPNAVSCSLDCFSNNKCIAMQFDTGDISCSLYRPGSDALECGVGAFTLCHVNAEIANGLS